MTRYDWTQPCCAECWDDRNPGRTATKLKVPDPEICCFCGGETSSGIYVRVDPSTVMHPRLRED